MTAMGIVPELAVTDTRSAAALLTGVFGFAQDGAFLRLGSQQIALAGVPVAPDHGVIDHLALSVPDVAEAGQAFIARGAVVDAGVTPDGPKEIAEFWGRGVRYLFLQGPEGARIELCCNLGDPRAPGHDHLGIPCRDLAATRAFALSLGGAVLADVALHRDDGVTQVSFVALAGSVLEFYAPPAGPGLLPARGKWSRLLVPGLVGDHVGPDGLTLSPLLA